MIMYDLKALTKTENRWPGVVPNKKVQPCLLPKMCKLQGETAKIKKKEVFKHIGTE